MRHCKETANFLFWELQHSWKLILANRFFEIDFLQIIFFLNAWIQKRYIYVNYAYYICTTFISKMLIFILTTLLKYCCYLNVSISLFYLVSILFPSLTHFFPMHPFFTPWKHQKTLWFFYVLRGWTNGALGRNG